MSTIFGRAAALVLLAAGVGVAPASHAATPSQGPACFAGQRVTTPRTPDTDAVPPAVAAAVQRRLDALSSRRTAATTAGPVVIPVLVHAIRTARPRDAYVTWRAALRQVAVMNQAYAGADAPTTLPTDAVTPADVPFRFRLAGYTLTRNRAWYHADAGTWAERAMKARLHRGGAGTLNLYFNKPATAGTLGWSTFPWAYARRPRMDGLVISVLTVVGNRGPYSLGRTAVHESGHWLGLFHTFQGGCNMPNDYVADTPEEASPNFGCPIERDTCTAPGLDPIHNFMDYSYDSCMWEFTPGQSTRMQQIYAAYR